MTQVRGKPRSKRPSCWPPSDRFRTVLVIGGVVILGVFLLVNLQVYYSIMSTGSAGSSGSGTGIGSSRSNNNGAMDVPQAAVNVVQIRRVLPPLPEYPMPKVDSTTGQPLNLTALEAWAENPLVGSYLAADKTRIHMPFVDLQTIYKGQGPPTQPMLKQHFASPDCVVLTRKGNKFHVSGVRVNQDRIAIADRPDEFWMGLFDGHGELGHVIAHAALAEFPKRLETIRTQALTTQETKQALHQMVLAINDNLPNVMGAGSTAISIWKRQKQLFISNVGDSKAFVVSVDRNQNKNIQVNVVYTTKPHKPNDPIERQRIESMGGKVQEPPAPQYSARVVIPLGDPPFDYLGLAMSRSLGDFDGRPYGVIPDPTTDVINLTDLDPKLDYLIILASDGLLDRVSELEIAMQMAESQLLTPTGKYLPLQAAEQLILKSSLSWRNDLFGDGYRDDISLAVHRLRI